jgi:hypothetical protein
VKLAQNYRFSVILSRLREGATVSKDQREAMRLCSDASRQIAPRRSFALLRMALWLTKLVQDYRHGD